MREATPAGLSRERRPGRDGSRRRVARSRPVPSAARGPRSSRGPLAQARGHRAEIEAIPARKRAPEWTPPSAARWARSPRRGTRRRGTRTSRVRTRGPTPTTSLIRSAPPVGSRLAEEIAHLPKAEDASAPIRGVRSRGIPLRRREAAEARWTPAPLARRARPRRRRRCRSGGPRPLVSKPAEGSTATSSPSRRSLRRGLAGPRDSSAGSGRRSRPPIPADGERRRRVLHRALAREGELVGDVVESERAAAELLTASSLSRS